MQRLRSGSTSLLGSLSGRQLKKKALNSWVAVQDTYFSTKDIFERHRVVFTVATSIASVITAWAGYSIRHYHESKVDQRLESIEKAMNNNYHLGHTEIKKIVDPGSSSTAAWVATAGTTLVIGYGLGWRGGTWYANRQFKREQMKMLGQLKPERWQLLGRIKPKGWPIRFLRRPLTRQRLSGGGVIPSENILKDGPAIHNPGRTHQSC